MSTPYSVSLNTVQLQIAENETSPRDSSCDRITQFLFDSPRKSASKIKKNKIVDETHSRKSEKLRAVTEQSPLAAAKVKKGSLERSKSFHGISFQENILYSPPKSNKSQSIVSAIDKLPICGDIFSEMIINNEWLGKLEKRVLHGTIGLNGELNDLQDKWRIQIQTHIDHLYREGLGYSCLGEQSFKNDQELHIQQVIRDSLVDRILLEPFQDVLKRVSEKLDEAAKGLKEKTDLLVIFRRFLRRATMKIHTFSGFLRLLRDMTGQKELFRLLSSLFLTEKNRGMDLISFLQALRDDAGRMYEGYLKELKWFQTQAAIIKDKHIFKWSEEVGETASISKIVRSQIIRSITMNGHRLPHLLINDEEAEDTLEGIIHQLNKAGIHPEASMELSAQHANDFSHDKWIPADGVLRLLSMGCWFHADQLIRKWFGEIYDIPMHTICKKGITCHVQITDPFVYDVRQIKTFSVYRRRIAEDPECFTVVEPEIGQITFQWHVHPGIGGKWKGELSILSWKLHEESSIQLKWLFMKALTHYHL